MHLTISGSVKSAVVRRRVIIDTWLAIVLTARGRALGNGPIVGCSLLPVAMGPWPQPRGTPHGLDQGTRVLGSVNLSSHTGAECFTVTPTEYCSPFASRPYYPASRMPAIQRGGILGVLHLLHSPRHTVEWSPGFGLILFGFEVVNAICFYEWMQTESRCRTHLESM